jgi:hypothetical protein
LPAAVSKTFLLAALPPDVVVSVRNLSIDAAALQVPAGARGPRDDPVDLHSAGDAAALR